ncbi:MAG: YafY family protein [Gammaproteobacteria bacterium]
MDRFDRIYALYRILSGRRTPVSRRALQEKLECSRATVQRAIDDLRTYLGAPIEYDRASNGYSLQSDTLFELPGLWFSPSELYALLATHRLLTPLESGPLNEELAPLQRRVEQLLAHRRAGHRALLDRVRILQMAPRPVDLDSFRKVAAATVERKRLKVLYHGRERDAITERWLSPQRLIHYRSNWYLDAWCHLRRALRSFSLDRLHVVAVGGEAKEIDNKRLDRHFATAYGIFAGEPKHTAVLRFTSSAARWVADEQWHPRQESRVLEDGGLELRIPYSDPRELIMDILKYGAEVEVLKPAALRREVARRLADALSRYGAGSG